MAAPSDLPLAPTPSFGLRLRLMMAMGVLASIVLLIGLAAPAAVSRLRASVHQAVQVDGRMAQLAADVAIKAEAARRFDQSYLLYIEDPQERTPHLERWEGAAAELEAAIAAFTAAATTEEDRRQARLWSAAYALYTEGFHIVAAGVTAGQLTRPAQANAQLDTYRQNIETLADLSDDFAARKRAQAEYSLVTLDMTGLWLNFALGGLSILGIGVAIAWSLYFPQRLTRPINALSVTATRLAAGELTARSGVSGGDEIAALGRAFDEMAATIEQRTADLQAQFMAAEAARYEAEAARAQVAEQLATIAAQRSALQEMSVPILPVAERVLVMPMIGALDSRRISEAQERALQAVETSHAAFLIIDITGVPVVDTQVAKGLVTIIQATSLLGARALLVGIRPEVAQTIVGLGIGLEGIVTRATLESGVSYTIQAANSPQRKGF